LQQKEELRKKKEAEDLLPEQEDQIGQKKEEELTGEKLRRHQFLRNDCS